MKWNELINISKEAIDFMKLLNSDEETQDNLKKLIKFLIESVNEIIENKYLISIKKFSPIMVGQFAFVPKILKESSRRKNLLLVSCYCKHLYVKTFIGKTYRIIYNDNQFTIERLKNRNIDSREFGTSCVKSIVSCDIFKNDVEKEYQILISEKRQYNRKKLELKDKKPNIKRGIINSNISYSMDEENNLIIHNKFLKLLGIDKDTVLEVYVVEDNIIIMKAH